MQETNFLTNPIKIISNINEMTNNKRKTYLVKTNNDIKVVIPFLSKNAPK